jgi:hypothetical protein
MYGLDDPGWIVQLEPAGTVETSAAIYMRFRIVR